MKQRRPKLRVITPDSSARSAAAVSDSDRDSLHILPLSTVPISAPALRRARLIKNARLDAVVEFFDSPDTGSGQLDINGLRQEFGWDEVPPHPDMILIRKLSLLPSYDVYSLRILLREHGIPIAPGSSLTLSPSKTRELSGYMTTFTRPLIQEIYGRDQTTIESADDIIGLFRSPDVPKIRERLGGMADRLEISIADIPKFLEDYGDISMSLAYYRQCLDEVMPAIELCLASIQELRTNFQLRQDLNFIRTTQFIEFTLNNLSMSISGRLENFDRSTSEMWGDLTAERFRKVSSLIRQYHTTIGGALCAVSVKMNAWMKLFPTASAGSPMKRAEFILSEMKQGMDRIHSIDSAPMLAALG